MILDRSVCITNINPEEWRNLSDILNFIFDPSPILWILTEKNIVIKAVIGHKEVIIPQNFSTKDIFKKFKNIGYIVCLDKTAWIKYYCLIQRSTDLLLSNHFFSFAVKQLYACKDIKYYKRKKTMLPPPPWIDFWGLVEWLCHDIPQSTYLILKIYERKNLWFSLYCEIENHHLIQVSSVSEINLKQTDKQNENVSIKLEKKEFFKILSKLVKTYLKESRYECC